MKKVLLLSVLLLQFILGDEVRSYDVTLDLLQQAHRVGGPDADPFAAPSEMDADDHFTSVAWLGPVVKEPGFESRFLKEAGELRECWRRVEGAIGSDDFEGKSVYDVKNEKLIVKGGLGLHRALRHSIENEMLIQLRATYSVYELPGVGLGDRSGFWDEVPEEAKLRGEVSWLVLPGFTSQAGSADGAIWAESDLQIDAYDSYVQIFGTFVVDLEEGGFSWKTVFPAVIGLSWAQELGSLDGKTTLMMVSRIDQIRSNGELWDEWVLNEEGTFMHDERLEVIRPWSLSEAPDDGSVEEGVFTVPPTFERFLAPTRQDEEDPFSAGDDLTERLPPIRKLLEQNGIIFREGDSVSFQRSSSTLVARLSKDNLELLEAIIHAEIGTGPPEVFSVELAEIEGEDFRKGKLLRKIGGATCSGGMVQVKLGDDLALQTEMQVDVSDELAELRMRLSESEANIDQASLKTGLAIRIGQPVVLKTSMVDGKRRSWVVTARRKYLENEVDDLLKARETKR